MDKKLTKHSGYVYNSKTKEGFQRMKRQGIVMPPFRIEDNVTKLLTAHFDRLLTKVSQVARGRALFEKAMTTDSMEGLIGSLQDAMIKAISSDKKKLYIQLSKQLGLAQKHFFDDFLADASDKVSLSVSFALDKDEVFQSRMNGLMEHYLNNSMQRIEREESFLKSAFLMELTDFVTGKADSLDSIKDIILSMCKTSVRDARFFARDQFARFNKAMTITSLEQAGADSVKWLTVGDRRVRPTHEALHGKIFPIGDIPPEKDDYNCRCGLVPVFKD